MERASVQGGIKGGSIFNHNHDFVLKQFVPNGKTKTVNGKEVEDGDLKLVGIVVAWPESTYQPAYKVMQQAPTGDLVETDYIVDANKAGELLLKQKNPDYNAEAPVEGTYSYNIIGKAFAALTKKGSKVYYRISTPSKNKDGSPFTGTRLTFRMFPNDGGPQTMKKQA